MLNIVAFLCTTSDKVTVIVASIKIDYLDNEKMLQNLEYFETNMNPTGDASCYQIFLLFGHYLLELDFDSTNTQNLNLKC